MQAGALTSYIDVAQVTLYAFWIFFFGLMFYLRREDKREGFPLVDDHGNLLQGFPELPKPKSFLLPHGGVVYAPRAENFRPLVGVRPTAGFAGAPLEPTGNPLLDGVGPAAYADRPDHPELTYDTGLPMIAPLRVAKEFTTAEEDPDPRGMELIGADGMTAGVVTDLWIDRSETIFRYLELKLTGSERTVMVPMNFVQFLARGRLRVGTIRADQFAQVPPLANPDTISLLEEDRITAYYGGGQMYSTKVTMGPVI